MKYIKYIFILIILAGLFSPVVQVNAAGTCSDPQWKTAAECGSHEGAWTEGYQLLAPLPCPQGSTNCSSGSGDQLTTVDPSAGLGSYLNLMIKIFIGLCAVLSVVMIVLGGLEYMTSELISEKAEGKRKIMGAILGLLIALGAYALLFTINPDLLKSDVNIPNSTVAPSLDDCVNQALVKHNGNMQAAQDECNNLVPS